MLDTHVMDLPDGRALSWVEVGDATQPTVFGLHGTPGSHRQMVFDQQPIVAAGVRYICPDRPGYGLSSYQPGRTLAAWALDLRFLADHLGVGRFAVMGMSGGGPHAAACASLLPDRVTALGLVSSVGPLADPGAEEGMLGFNRVMTKVSRRAPALMVPPYLMITVLTKRWPERAIDTFRRQLPPPDADVLGRERVRDGYVDDLRHASGSSGRAAVQDFALFTRDWGFRLEDIAAPVHIWHGDEDGNVPIAHAHLQGQMIPGSVMHECPGEGHMLFVDHLEEILLTLTT